MANYRAFKEHFIEKAKLCKKDANVWKLLLADTLGCPYDKVILKLDQQISEWQLEWLEILSERYFQGEAIQYLLGYCYFYGLKFHVNPKVLIPRFVTEELVAWVLEDNKEDRLSLVDVGTGSGNIALALKSQRPNWEIKGTDVYSEALEVAKLNARFLSLDVTFLESDFLSAIAKMDIVVSNPPYIAPNDPEVDLEVLNNEPRQALFTEDKKGLASYERIFQQLKSRPFKLAYFEFGYRQKADLEQLLATFSYKHYEFRKDITGKDRFLKIYNT